MQRDDTTSRLTRRGFLKAAGGLALAAGCQEDGAAGGVDGGGPGPGDGPAADQAPATSTVVAGAQHADVDTMVRQAVALAGGLDALKAGQTVFIKPNAVYATRSAGVVTSVEVLAAVVRLVKERGCRVVVGDRPARQFESAQVLTDTGMRAAALAAGADEVYAPPRPAADPQAWVAVKPPHHEETWPGRGILAMRRIVEADHFINLAVCKDHRWAVFSLTMKNLIGAVGDDTRDAMHYERSMPERLSRDIALLNQAFRPILSLIDARTALLNGGPEGLPPQAVKATPGLVLCSSDRVALDAAGVALLKLGLSRATVANPDEAQPFLDSMSPWKLPQIVHGAALGLGVGRPEDVSLRLPGVADAAEIERIFRTA
jgi:uncharacterized protein (DUF362 family)